MGSREDLPRPRGARGPSSAAAFDGSEEADCQWRAQVKREQRQWLRTLDVWPASLPVGPGQ